MTVGQISLAVASVAGATLAVVINWFPRPKKLRTGWLVVILVLLLAANISAAIWEGNANETASSARGRGSTTGASAAPKATSAAVPKALPGWVADVNRMCQPVQARLTASAPSEGTSTQELVAVIKRAIDIYKPLIRDLNGLDLPSDPVGNAKASDWMNAYNDWYRRLLTAVESLDTGTGVKPAKDDFMAAGVTMKSKSDALGITCPGMKI
jgi:hypothetical protein